MKKLVLYNGKVKTCLILLCLFMAQSCRKDILQPNSNVIQNPLSIAEAKNWYITQGFKKVKVSSTNSIGSENDVKESFSLAWNMATENLAKNLNAVVAIPLNKENKLSFGKYGFKKLLVHKNENGVVEGEIMEVIFNEQDVKDRTYKELYEMQKFNGKVVLYTMQMNFKTGYSYKMER